MAAPTPPPDDMDMTLFADECTDRASPPPHLAARFYRNARNTSSRRRSSAHSSRRSSLSSIHSRASNVSCHGGPRSTHIAQHLRRASIIESRKARLADRAAHAEQVRLRAAAAKAATKVTYSEEKAIAAQAAREKLLAEITSRCEEEVRRAKKIAEETKEKKAAENARLREEMAEKFADVARRKSIYQSSLRRPRTTSLAAVEEKKVNTAALRKISRITAAKVIQKAWRGFISRRILNNFKELNIDLSNASNRSFEQVTQLISEENTLQATSRLLKHLGIIASDDEDTSSTGPVRMFLSAYLILAHPMQALSHGGGQPQEQELVTKSAALIEPFEIYIGQYAGDHGVDKAGRERQADLTFAYNDFSAAFQAWKSQDLETIVEVMVASFVNLDLIIQSTKNDTDGRVGEDYLNAVRQEQVKLLAKLKKLAGPENALNRVRTAVRKARKQRAVEKKEKNQSEEHVPRAITPVDQRMDTQVPLTPPTTPRQLTSRRESAPTSFITRLGQTMTILPSNREIAHEMQISGSFEVQQQPWTESRKQFMDTLRSSMRESMQSGGNQTAAAWTHSMALLIREKLISLISTRHPLYERIDNFLDPKLIDQQSRNGVFSYPSFFDTIATLIAQVCSPGRDEAVQAFAADNTSDTIDRLFSLINVIDLMTLDHINFQFRMATRSVVEHGHEHEHSMFERDLQNNVHSLQHTTRWWNHAKSTLGSSANGNAIYSRGLVDLVFQNSHFSYGQLPETLHIDYLRLLNLRAKALQIVSLSSILLTTKLRLQRNREAVWTNVKERLMSTDLLSVDSVRIVSLIETSHRMPDPTKEGLRNFVTRALPPAVAAARNAAAAEQERLASIQQQRDYTPSSTDMDIDDVFAEQIATYVLKSLREHVFARLSATSTAEKVRATTSAAEVLSRAGMPEFVVEVAGMVDVLERVRAVDLKAHGRWYDEVAMEAAN
jgi:T-complex protein 11